jgi:hypothetical protein
MEFFYAILLRSIDVMITESDEFLKFRQTEATPVQLVTSARDSNKCAKGRMLARICRFKLLGLSAKQRTTSGPDGIRLMF